jgi:hypothetical protein
VDPFFYLEGKELRCTTLGTKGLPCAGSALPPPSPQSQTLYQGGQKAAQALNMEVVGQHDLGGRGFNADVWAHEGFAYIGHWGFTDWAQGSKTRFCPPK